MTKIYAATGLEVLPDERRILVRGEAISLGARAFDLLLALIDNRDRVVSKEELLSLVWPDATVEENNLTVQMSALRKALGRDAIATIAGRGYRFALPLLNDRPVQATDRPVIAVLAFDTDEAHMQFFADGVSDEIIQRLARGAHLGVIGRTSSFQFRGDRKAEAADRLKCSHVFDGAIRRAGDTVRINAHLIDTLSRETIWSERYDRNLNDMLAVQDEIAENIASALNRTFKRTSTRAIDPDAFDLYLRARPTSYEPNQLAAGVGLLEVATQRAPHFVEAWGRLAYLRAFLHLYLPFAERAQSAERVVRDASHALALDAQNVDALAARCFVTRPFGDFAAFDTFLDRLRAAPGTGDGKRYVGWLLRHTGRMRESLEETQRVFALDPLDPMTINLMALSYMACGRPDVAAPLYSDLVERLPSMSFPVSSLLRAYAFLEDWEAVDRLLAAAATRPLRELQDTIPFVRAKRDPTGDARMAWRCDFEDRIAKTGAVDVARLVYAAHLGFVDEAYRAAATCRLGPSGADEDVMGPDGYRTAMLFEANMPELRNDARFPEVCARLGLANFWIESGKWPDCAHQAPYDFKAACQAFRRTPQRKFFDED
ncbi:adenylate cyclase [alpha proteobacterium U9-1i]|nr:adenylate cyclase [alpha proteobacterium U9-1i]